MAVTNLNKIRRIVKEIHGLEGRNPNLVPQLIQDMIDEKYNEVFILEARRFRRLSKFVDYKTSPKKRVSFHPDLGWAIYVKRHGDWERETDLTPKEALAEVIGG